MAKKKQKDPSHPEQTKLLISIEEAAELLSIGRTLMFDLVKRKAVKACKIGRRTLISKSELEAFQVRLEKECGQ